MNKRVLVLTGTTEDIVLHKNLNDNKMQEVFELTLPSKQRYAMKYGYDLLTMRSFGNDDRNNFKDVQLGCLRLYRTFQMLEHYDVVMWLDADAIVTNDTYSIEDFLVKDKTFYASYDWVWRESFSTGNLIIQRTEHTNELFQMFLQIGKQVADHVMSEQLAMNWIYKNTPLKSTFEIMEHKFLNGVPEFLVETPTWKADNNRTGIVSPWNKDCFLAHLTGCSNRDRVDILKTKMEEFV
jgi:hypothetical protein